MFFDELPDTNNYSKWLQIWNTIQRIEKSRKLKLDTDTWDRVYDYLEQAMYENDNPDYVYDSVVSKLYEMEYERRLDAEHQRNRKRWEKLRKTHAAGAKAYRDAIQAQTYTKPRCPHKAKHLIEAWEQGYEEASRKHSHSSLVKIPETHTHTRFVI